MTMW